MNKTSKDKSNITVKSNIELNDWSYSPLESPNFIKKIRGYEAIRKFLLKYHSGEKFLVEGQKQEYKFGVNKCSHSDDGDFVWGSYINKSGSIEYGCRCEKLDCSEFYSCRKGLTETEISWVRERQKQRLEKENIKRQEKENLLSSDLLSNEKNEVKINVINDDNTVDCIPNVNQVKHENLVSAEVENQNLDKKSYDKIQSVDVCFQKENKSEFINNKNETSIFKETETVIDDKEELIEILIQSDNSTKFLNDEKEKPKMQFNDNSIKSQFKGKQEEVIECHIDEKLLVDAPPGSGKTYCLVERLKYLYDNFSIDNTSVLVLCFTRTATLEVRKRVDSLVDNLNTYYGLIDIDIRTIDSFATWLLVQKGESQLFKLDYDQRINQAIKYLKKNPHILNTIKHFIIDEVQDLVGVRAEFIKTILEIINGGVTLLGDRCQGIYDYQVKDSSGMNSVEFYTKLKEIYKHKLKVIELDKNYRQSDELLKNNKIIRKQIISGDKDKINIALSEVFEKMPSLGELVDVSREQIQPIEGENIAFLVRKNSEALLVSNLLNQKRIRHKLNRGNDEYLSYWIGALITELSDNIITYNEFEKTYCSLFRTSKDVKKCWQLFLELGNEDDNSLRVNKQTIIRTIQDEAELYQELYVYNKHSIEVSTIHKAKGREYTNVVLLSRQNEVNLDEAKVNYVSLTRAKTVNYKIGMKQKKLKLDSKSNRHIAYSSVTKGIKRGRGNVATSGKITMIELIDSEDINFNSFCDLSLFNDEASVIQNQKYIVNNIKAGDELKLKFLKKNNQILFGIYHSEDRLIGCMNNSFTELISQKNLRDKFEENKIIYPSEINRLFVDEVITYIATDVDGIPQKYKKNKMWNAVTISGLGKIEQGAY